MKIARVTKEYYRLEDGREFYFDEPLEKVLTVKQLQKILDKNKDIIEGLRNAVVD